MTLRRVIRPIRLFLLCGAAALGVLAGVVSLTGASPAVVAQTLIYGAFGTRYNLAETLIQTTPLILTGLAVALAFRCRLFNIGAEGQLLMGATAAVWVGTSPLPKPLLLPLALCAAGAAGAFWAGIAAVLKLYRGVSGGTFHPASQLRRVADGGVHGARPPSGIRQDVPPIRQHCHPRALGVFDSANPPAFRPDFGGCFGGLCLALLGMDGGRVSVASGRCGRGGGGGGGHTGTTHDIYHVFAVGARLPESRAAYKSAASPICSRTATAKVTATPRLRSRFLRACRRWACCPLLSSSVHLRRARTSFSSGCPEFRPWLCRFCRP